MSRQPNPSLANLWNQRIEQQGLSGLSVQAFCQQAGIQAHSFHYWRRKLCLNQSSSESSGSPSADGRSGNLVPIRITASVESGVDRMTIRFQSGVLIDAPSDTASLRGAIAEILRSNHDNQRQGA